MASLFLILLIAAPLQAAVVSGTVYLGGGESRQPAVGVKLLVRAADGPEVLLSRETDAEGRYVLSDLPKGAIIISAVKRGYVLSPQTPARQLALAPQDNVTGLDFDLIPGGIVAGRVSDAEGEPLQGVQVELKRPGANPAAAPPLRAATDDTGTFRLFGLEPGRYVLLGRRGMQNSPPVYFPGRSEEKDAELIEIAAGAEKSGIDLRFPPDQTGGGPPRPDPELKEIPAGQDTQPAAAQPAVVPQRAGEGPRGAIGGVVVSAQSGEPLGGATITLSQTAQGRLSTQSVKAAPDGAFLFPQLAPGVYGISAKKAGYRPRALTGGVILSENQGRTGLEIKLDREPSISGRVEDGDRQPVIGATVTAYALRWVKGRRIAMHGPSVTADDRGRYRLAGLPPGRYVIGASLVPAPDEQASGDLDLGTGKSFYPSGERAVDGVALDLRFGQELQEINLRLAPRESYSVSGVVTDAETRGPCNSCTIRALNLDESYSLSMAKSAVAADGSYRVRGLTPGSYRIIAEKRSGGRTLVSSRTVQVERRDLTGVHLVSGVLRTLTGRVILESPPPAEPGSAQDKPQIAMEVILGPADGIGTAVSARVASDGSFRAINPPCESCMVLLEQAPQGGYLRTVRVQGRELPAPEIEIPGDTTPPPIELVVSFKSGSLSGQVARPSQGGERPPVDAILLLVPAANESPYLAPQTTGIRPDGGFRMSGIPPGAYTAFAVPRNGKLDWGSPDVRRQMESFGKAVRISADRPETIELPLAPEDQT